MRAALTGLIATALVIPAALADVIVIRANGPSAARYPAGKSLPDSARLSLARGDEIVLLDAHGTRTVAGPGVVAVAGGPTVAARSTLTQLASATNSRRQRVGAVRNADGTEVRPSIFLVDLAAPGRMCVADPAAVSVWRAASQTAAVTTIKAATGASATLTWIKGQSTQRWPAALPVAAGASYRIMPTSGGTTVPIEFRFLTSQPADLPQLGRALIAQGCRAQLDLLVATASAATAATAASGGGG